MQDFEATIKWQCDGKGFLNNEYSRAHTWEFDGGAVIHASATPHVVPAPWSVAENVDPEEAFVASISSCHMLFFLSIAAKQGIQVNEYIDRPTGTMSRIAKGRHGISRVVLRPSATYAPGTAPSPELVDSLHHQAHEQCFIANSVSAEILIEPQR